MTPFEHVTALLSFVYALALAHLLIRLGELIIARERVRSSGLLVLAMANAIIVVFENWLSLWDLRSIAIWDLGSITIQFVFAVGVFLICVFVAPRVPPSGPIDLEESFRCQRFAFYSGALALNILALIANLDYLKSANATVFFKMNGLVLSGLVPTLSGLLSQKRIVQYLAGFGFLAENVAYLLIFCRVLS